MSLKSADMDQRKQTLGTSLSKLTSNIGILLLIVILSTKFGVDQIGLYFFLFATVNLVSNIAGGLGEAIRKRVSAREGKQESYLTTALVATFIFQIIIVVTSAILVNVIPTEYLPNIITNISGPLFVGSTLFLFSQSTAKIMINYNSGLGYPSRSEWLGKALPGIMFFILSVFIILMNQGLAYIFLVGSLSYGLSTVLMFITTRPNLYSKVSYEKFLSLLEFGKWSIPNKIIMDFYKGLDVIVLGLVVSSTVVGFYESSQNLAHLVFAIPYGLGAVIAVKVSGLDAEDRNDDIKNILRRDLPISVSLPVGFFFFYILFGEPILGEIFGEDFIGAYLFLVYLGIKEILLSYRIPVESLNYGIDQPEIPLYSNIISVSFNVITILPLIGLMGGIGAVVSTVLAEFIRTIVISYFSREYVKHLDFKRLLLPLIAGITIFAPFWVMESSINSGIISSALFSMLFLFLYLLSHYLLDRLYKQMRNR